MNRAGLALCERAIALYRGDLCYSPHAKALNERERLRVGVLDLLALVAEQHYRQGDVVRALCTLNQLLDLEFLREDAQRLAMRCYSRLGHRSQALRQYSLLRQELAMEFDAEPEQSTTRLYELIKRDPESLG